MFGKVRSEFVKITKKCEFVCKCGEKVLPLQRKSQNSVILEFDYEETISLYQWDICGRLDAKHSARL